MTIEQVIKDIESGKSKMIFYSAGTPWWTHLESDLEEASKIGRQRMRENHDRMMKDPKLPQEHKDRMNALFELANSGKAHTPLDPLGCTLYQTDKPMDFIRSAKKKKQHYGRHGLKALILSHHQNCKEPMATWEDYNKMIDFNENVPKS